MAAIPLSLRQVATGGGSKTLEEARKNTLAFFRRACRAVPYVMDIYNLHDLITTVQLRSTVNSLFRKNSNVTNPQVIDMLIFKGTEELNNIIDQSKQRHHIIGQYVVGQEGLTPTSVGASNRLASEFLRKFYDSNNF
eukprot:TRINITY_DN1712_c0_g1_i2.p1 TRINITY_DN1712_c0_g1~~TRINITY_DN1712_c0_g1_i2.p1  ORF type:complete len:137 (+),score=6.61 TRINITY_DN1712_c0_g1_i2:138-548(+)